MRVCSFRGGFLIFLGLTASTLAAASRTAAQDRPDLLSAEDHVKGGDALPRKHDVEGTIAEYRESLRLNAKNDVARSMLDAPGERQQKAYNIHMSRDKVRILAYALFGLGAGIYFFFKGFWIYREYRVVEDTPEMPIRSIAMGLTHIHGKAEGEQTVPGPVSKTPCFFYKVDIEAWRTDSKGRGSWSHYKTHTDGLRFYLADSSGKVQVEAHGAEYDLQQSGRRETSWSATDEDLGAYIERVGGSPGRYRLTEFCILPEQWYDVTGTCAEIPEAKDEHDRNLIRKGENEPTFLISWRPEKELERTLRHRAALYVFGGAGLAVVCLAIVLAILGGI